MYIFYYIADSWLAARSVIRYYNTYIYIYIALVGGRGESSLPRSPSFAITSGPCAIILYSISRACSPHIIIQRQIDDNSFPKFFFMI